MQKQNILLAGYLVWDPTSCILVGLGQGWHWGVVVGVDMATDFGP